MMNNKIEKICEGFRRNYAKALENGEKTTEIQLEFEAKLLKHGTKEQKKIAQKDAIIKEQLDELASQRMEIFLYQALLREMRSTLDKHNLSIEGWDRYVFEKSELEFFNLLPARFSLDEFHRLGATELGLVEGSREGMLDFYKQFHLVSEKHDGSFAKMIDKVPSDLNQLAYIKDRVSLMVS